MCCPCAVCHLLPFSIKERIPLGAYPAGFCVCVCAPGSARSPAPLTFCPIPAQRLIRCLPPPPGSPGSPARPGEPVCAEPPELQRAEGVLAELSHLCGVAAWRWGPGLGLRGQGSQPWSPRQGCRPGPPRKPDVPTRRRTGVQGPACESKQRNGAGSKAQLPLIPVPHPT